MADITLGSRTALGIPYTRMHGSPTVSVTQDEATAKEELIMAKGDFPNFIFESFPIPESLNNFIDVRRQMGAIDGVSGIPPLLTKTIEVVPLQSDLPLDDQPYVKVTINYETAQDKEGDEEDPETFLTHTLNAGGQLITYPAQHMEPFDPGTDGWLPEPNIPMSVFVPTIEHTWSWARVQIPPFAAIRAAMGKVNKSTFLGSPAEQLLFLGVSASQDFTFEGEEPWKIDYKFSERNKEGVGWNHFFTPSTGTWIKLKTANGDLAYEESSAFGDLFKEGP